MGFLARTLVKLLCCTLLVRAVLRRGFCCRLATLLSEVCCMVTATVSNPGPERPSVSVHSLKLAVSRSDLRQHNPSHNRTATRS